MRVTADEFIGTNISRARSRYRDGYFPRGDNGSAQTRWRGVCSVVADGRAPLHHHCADRGAWKIEIPGGGRAFVACRQPAFADLGIDCGSHVSPTAQLSELGIPVILQYDPARATAGLQFP